MSGLLTMDEVAARLSAQAVPITEVETVALREAAGRWLARDLMSAIDVPTSDTSAMDGYALRAADIAEGGSRLVVSQRLFAGDRSAPLLPGTAARIFTGAGLPPGADCVVMQEAAREEDGQVSIDERPEPGQFVRRRG
ncbi:MAG TPA: molybdopterin molybdenumtransferase MoeA, partial [Rhodocyclaceae bacterium]|nr:molybdopterin molybdenumtransferase MoeA [Rhodocyclaceae bacterium]